MGCKNGSTFTTPKLGEISPTNGVETPCLITDLDTPKSPQKHDVTLITSRARELHEGSASIPLSEQHS